MKKKGGIPLIGHEIRKWRKRRKLKQGELAKLAGIATSTIGMIETGRTNPSFDTVISIARALKVPITAFVDDSLIPIESNTIVVENMPAKIWFYNGQELPRDVVVRLYMIIKLILEVWEPKGNRQEDVIEAVVEEVIRKKFNNVSTE